MAKVVLDTQAFETDFFADFLLFALGAPGLKDYRLCWYLNNFLGMCFCRQPELDIQVFAGAGTRRKGRGLFDQEEEEDRVYYFPVFRHDIPGMEASVYMYNNRSGDRFLIPELRSADYFLLVPSTPDGGEPEWISVCKSLSEIAWIKVFSLDKLKSRRNFIL